MTTATEATTPMIQGREVTNEQERLELLPRHFGGHMLTVEHAVYSFMRQLAGNYAGGFWKFFELSNGGVYLAPSREATFKIGVEGNGFSGEMSADAAGITACLFALSHLSFEISNDSIADHYHLLLEFAAEHAEASAILSAID